MPRLEPQPSRGIVPVLLVSGVVAVVAIGAARGLWGPNVHNGLLALACTGVGAGVLWERPRHRVGVLLLATGVVQAVMFTGRQFGHAPAAGGSEVIAWLGIWPLAIALTLITLAVILYPDGRLPSAGWRLVVIAVVAVGTVCAALSAAWPVEYASVGISATHPFAASAPDAAQRLWDALAHPAYAIFQVLWVAAIATRWRTANPIVRRQLAWLVGAAGLSVIALLVGLVVAGSPRAGVLAAVLVPIAAGVAIVHRQFAASYAALTWLTRAPSGDADLPAELAAAAANAVGASGAVLWMGDPERLHPIGLWPAERVVPEPASASELSATSTTSMRPVSDGGRILGALTVTHGAGSSPTRAEERLLDDLAAQAGLVLAHLDLAGVIERERAAGHLEELTPRERDVLDLMARGHSNQAIAGELHLSIKTVEPLVSSIFGKLELHQDATSNRRVLAVLAYLRA